MSLYLGLDTSNYTTSAALYDSERDVLIQKKQLLPTPEGALGLRQSDAVFHHTRQLPELLEGVCAELEPHGSLSAVAASDRPQQVDGSYMPCFLVGCGAARQMAAVLGVPLHRFTHQQGHVAAAAYGAGHPELLSRPFLAFHVSGGTTDALLVTPDEQDIIHCHRVGGSLDLKAGQLIDRVGGKLGLPFPAGPELDRLAQTADSEKALKPAKPSLSEHTYCHLSGMENRCADRIRQGVEPALVARYCLDSVCAALDAMTAALLERYPDYPVLFAGGVTANSGIRAALSDKYHALFAPPALSADNAAGIALLCCMAQEGRWRA